MVETRDLVQQTINSQHQTRLLVKKVDVIGVIQSKIDDKVKTLDEDVKQIKTKIDNLDIDEFENNTKELSTNVEIVANNQEFIKSEFGNIINQTDEIDKSITETKKKLLSELNGSEKANTEQLNNIDERVQGIELLIQTHVEDTSLSHIEDNIKNVKGQIEDLKLEFSSQSTSIDEVLTSVQNHIQILKKKENEVSTLNQSFASLMGKTTKILIDVDDKVCRLSPIYSAPTMDEVENSYRELASQDVLDLLSELHGYQKNVEQESIPEDIGTELVTEEQSEQKTKELTEQEKATTHKKGFLSSLFGGE